MINLINYVDEINLLNLLFYKIKKYSENELISKDVIELAKTIKQVSNLILLKLKLRYLNL